MRFLFRRSRPSACLLVELPSLAVSLGVLLLACWRTSLPWLSPERYVPTGLKKFSPLAFARAPLSCSSDFTPLALASGLPTCQVPDLGITSFVCHPSTHNCGRLFINRAWPSSSSSLRLFIFCPIVMSSSSALPSPRLSV